MTNYKNTTFAKPFKRYINLGKFFAKRNQTGGWIPCTTGYGAASSAIRVDHGGGIAVNEVIGRVTITWYAKFRGPVPV